MRSTEIDILGCVGANGQPPGCLSNTPACHTAWRVDVFKDEMVNHVAVKGALAAVPPIDVVENDRWPTALSFEVEGPCRPLVVADASAGLQTGAGRNPQEHPDMIQLLLHHMS